MTELAKPFGCSQPTITKHLKVLERAGLISSAVDAQRRPRRMEGDALKPAIDWLKHYRETWANNYERLDAVLEELQLLEKQAEKGKTT
ncbi:ArsR/SmtB family transcription factor [Novosphingopyxis sp.]|uniref:ArsR/SmtB family transcription factor n=1 Tax=Novosphingopyxis sp. TaxID=2709690 RepID=UPI003B599AB6